MSELVTIASGLDLQTAYLARAALGGSGIYCFLANEFTMGTHSQVAFAARGVELRVREDDVPAAIEVLTGKEFDAASPPDAFPAMEKCCPECGSAKFTRKRVGWLRTLFGTSCGAWMRLPRDRKTCARCGHQWQ